MCQFPKKPDPDEASLVAFTGSGAAKFRDDLGEDINWTLQRRTDRHGGRLQDRRHAVGGGGRLVLVVRGNFTDPSGQTILGLPLSIAANATNSSTPFWTVSNAPKIGVFCLHAEDGSGKHQELLAQAPITQAGFATPAKLPIAWRFSLA